MVPVICCRNLICCRNRCAGKALLSKKPCHTCGFPPRAFLAWHSAFPPVLYFFSSFFGLLLEGAGAGNYIIQLSFSLLGRFRGGPAKAAVVASALTGMISGSSTANVVTTGTFTIPLMRRVGFSAEKAGAVEVASSTNGQLTPPIMGAAAFLMVEYVGVSYLEVIKHAFLPAIISYIALVYIVHLEAVKADMKGLASGRASRGFFTGGFWSPVLMFLFY